MLAWPVHTSFDDTVSWFFTAKGLQLSVAVKSGYVQTLLLSEQAMVGLEDGQAAASTSCLLCLSFCGFSPGVRAVSVHCGFSPGVRVVSVLCGFSPGVRAVSVLCGFSPGVRAVSALCGFSPGVRVVSALCGFSPAMRAVSVLCGFSPAMSAGKESGVCLLAPALS